jgi:chromate transporter
VGVRHACNFMIHLTGMNAASVGLILASVFIMTLDVLALSPFPSFCLCIGLFAFTAVDQFDIFEPFVVVGGILLGLLGWGAKLH